MNKDQTAIRLAGKLSRLTSSGKIRWVDAGALGPWGDWPGQVFKASFEDGVIVQIAEVPVPRSTIRSYYFGLAEGKPEIFEVFAEGYPIEPTDERLKLLASLRELYALALDSARGTWQKVERFEHLLERMA